MARDMIVFTPEELRDLREHLTQARDAGPGHLAQTHVLFVLNALVDALGESGDREAFNKAQRESRNAVTDDLWLVCPGWETSHLRHCDDDVYCGQDIPVEAHPDWTGVAKRCPACLATRR